MTSTAATNIGHQAPVLDRSGFDGNFAVMSFLRLPTDLFSGAWRGNRRVAAMLLPIQRLEGRLIKRTCRDAENHRAEDRDPQD